MQVIGFTLPNGDEFSIPVEWWAEAGMTAFEPQSAYYCYDSLPQLLVRIKAIEPPQMDQRKHLDHSGFDHVRMVNVLDAIVSRKPMPPVEVEPLPSNGEYQYRLHHGAHRFFASAAVGFTHVPAMLWP
jgi:hypothetical protein